MGSPGAGGEELGIAWVTGEDYLATSIGRGEGLMADYRSTVVGVRGCAGVMMVVAEGRLGVVVDGVRGRNLRWAGRGQRPRLGDIHWYVPDSLLVIRSWGFPC